MIKSIWNQLFLKSYNNNILKRNLCAKQTNKLLIFRQVGIYQAIKNTYLIELFTKN
jgi:hypothetical protein